MKKTIKIGRDNTNDIIINEPRVSRNHALITKLDDGSYEVKDLGSTNGTYVNGQRISRHILTPGDTLQVASSRVDWEVALKNIAASKTEPVIREEPISAIRKTITVGSAEDNDIVLENDYVSAHHATISLMKNSDYFLEDLNSRNGSFVNGTRVAAKNFSLTDIIRLANSELPVNWFEHKSLVPHFYRDHKKAIVLITSLVFVATASLLMYFNLCEWFGKSCNLSAAEMHRKNKDALVYIEHEYYYTLSVNGITYYVGKNKFRGDIIEPNTDKNNINAYSKVSGVGCFIGSDGSIVTSPAITNPWLNPVEQERMRQEVITGKMIKGFKAGTPYTICGETYRLSFIQAEVANNPQNYIQASSKNECLLTDSTTAVITSVKLLPQNASFAKIRFKENSEQPLHHTDEKYYGYFRLPEKNKITSDTFLIARDTININNKRKVPVIDILPTMTEGSPVFNTRGELIGILWGQEIYHLQNFIKQIPKQ
jgi:pSer/pThr/pTyr-binding forkhead associated (FHA) protein